MKQLLNTLYVTTQGAYLAKDGETVLVRVEEESRLRVPIHTLTSIVCFGRVSSSPLLMGMCAERGVALAFLTENGRFLARVEGPVSGNVLLRREQYRRAENDGQTAEIARSVVIAKVANCRTVLQRAVREKPEGAGCAELEAAALRLLRLGETLQKPLDVEHGAGARGGRGAGLFRSV